MNYFLFLEATATPPITATAAAAPAIGRASPVAGDEPAFLTVFAAAFVDEAAVVAAAVVATASSATLIAPSAILTLTSSPAAFTN